MTPVQEKVLRCIGLLGSAIRCLTAACCSDRVSSLYVDDALDFIRTAVQILVDNGPNTH